MVQGYRYELGATLRISCDTGYNMVPESSSFRTCVSDGQGGGEWSEVDPVCECTFIVETLYINNSLSMLEWNIICSKKRPKSSNYARGNLFEFASWEQVMSPDRYPSIIRAKYNGGYIVSIVFIIFLYLARF